MGNATAQDEFATVSFDDQQTGRETVRVREAQLPDGGFVTIHDDTVFDDQFGSVRGTSEYFTPGRSRRIEITLDDPIEQNGTFFAMPHRDTNGNESYDFLNSEGAEDAPYLNANDEVVLDGAQISLASEPYPIPTPTPSTETPVQTPTRTPSTSPSPSPESPTRTPTATAFPRTTTDDGGAFSSSVTALPEEAVGGGVLAVLGGLAYAILGRSGDGDTTDGSPSAPPGDGQEPASERSGPPERAPAQSGAAADGATESSAGSSGPAGGESVDSRSCPPVGAPRMAEVPNGASVASPPRRPALEQKQFTIVEEIGAGGQAIITEARVPEAQQPPATVALREPDTSATLTREAVETFLRQAETWATVDAREREKQRWADSEHIVGVIATGDRQPWLAMEYMDGGDVEELLVKHPDGLPVGQALWTGACVCKGLEIAHQLGRAHLDVKPRNVLLRETDGWPWPKLADWGLSRTLAEETGTMEGLSVQYAAPEQFDSTKFGDPDQLTDIYQTGALVYALLTGEPPTSGSQFEVMQQVMSEGSITPPSDRRAELPAAVDAAVGLALEREKTERYGSIGNFGDALHALRTGGRVPPAVAARLDE
jgi:hypothetical protein